MSDQTLTGDERIDNMLLECIRTLQTKGADYTVGSSDRLFNFRRVGELNGLKMDEVWSVYVMKHIFAIMNYIKTGGKSESEPIDSRIVDVIVYMLLFSKIVDEMKKE